MGVCGAQVVLVHVVELLVKQLCTSASRFVQTLEEEGEGVGLLLNSTLIGDAEKQAEMLQTLLNKYNGPDNIESKSEFPSLPPSILHVVSVTGRKRTLAHFS